MADKGEEFAKVITAHWGAAIILGVFSLVAAAISGAWIAKFQTPPPSVASPGDETKRSLENLRSRLESEERECRKKDEQLNSALQEIKQLQRQIATDTRPPVDIDATSVSARSLPSPLPPPQRVEKGDFNFELRGCTRRGEVVRCSLTVTNVSDVTKSMNLCGASYLVDDSGQKPATRVQFAGGGCGSFHLDSRVPNAVELSASLPRAEKLNVVLADGNWFSFSGSAIFRDVKIVDGH
jgi:hypothetical protein